MKKTKIPLIFSVAGALGVIATGALASLATIKAVKLLEEEGMQVKDIPLDKETVSKVWKCYILPASLAAVSVGCIFAANGSNRKMLVTLAGGLAAMSESYREYKTRVSAKDYNLDKKISEEMGREHYVSPWGDDMGEKVIFYDSVSDRLFARSWYEVSEAFYHFNHNFMLRGYAWLNELYEFLGLAPVDEGNQYGFYTDWFYVDGLTPWIEYSIKEEVHNGRKVNNIIFVWPEIDLNGIDMDCYSYNEPEYWISPC